MVSRTLMVWERWSRVFRWGRNSGTPSDHHLPEDRGPPLQSPSFEMVTADPQRNECNPEEVVAYSLRVLSDLDLYVESERVWPWRTSWSVFQKAQISSADGVSFERREKLTKINVIFKSPLHPPSSQVALIGFVQRLVAELDTSAADSSGVWNGGGNVLSTASSELEKNCAVSNNLKKSSGHTLLDRRLPPPRCATESRGGV